RSRPRFCCTAEPTMARSLPKTRPTEAEELTSMALASTLPLVAWLDPTLKNTEPSAPALPTSPTTRVNESIPTRVFANSIRFRLLGGGRVITDCSVPPVCGVSAVQVTRNGVASAHRLVQKGENRLRDLKDASAVVYGRSLGEKSSGQYNSKADQ